MAATIGDQQFSCSADFASKSNTTCTHHASVGEQRDLLTDVILVHPLNLGFIQSANWIAILVGVILQVALTRLIANGTIERVIEQQQLERHLLSCLDLLGIGTDDRPLSDRGLAAGNQFGTHHNTAVRLLFANLDQAHSA